MPKHVPNRSYSNAGNQKAYAGQEIRRYYQATPTEYFSLGCVAEVLGINRNKVCKTPLQVHLFEKRRYYVKGDVDRWLAEELKKPESLLAELRQEQAASEAKMKKHPSRRYVSGQLRPDERKETIETHRAKRESGSDRLQEIINLWM